MKDIIRNFLGLAGRALNFLVVQTYLLLYRPDPMFKYAVKLQALEWGRCYQTKDDLAMDWLERKVKETAFGYRRT